MLPGYWRNRKEHKSWLFRWVRTAIFDYRRSHIFRDPFRDILSQLRATGRPWTQWKRFFHPAAARKNQLRNMERLKIFFYFKSHQKLGPISKTSGRKTTPKIVSSLMSLMSNKPHMKTTMSLRHSIAATKTISIAKNEFTWLIWQVYLTCYICTHRKRIQCSWNKRYFFDFQSLQCSQNSSCIG